MYTSSLPLGFNWGWLKPFTLSTPVWLSGKKVTLPEANSSHLKMDGWNTSFVLGWPIFRCYISFREGNGNKHHGMPFKGFFAHFLDEW